MYVCVCKFYVHECVCACSRIYDDSTLIRYPPQLIGQLAPPYTVGDLNSGKWALFRTMSRVAAPLLKALSRSRITASNLTISSNYLRCCTRSCNFHRPYCTPLQQLASHRTCANHSRHPLVYAHGHQPVCSEQWLAYTATQVLRRRLLSYGTAYTILDAFLLLITLCVYV